MPLNSVENVSSVHPFRSWMAVISLTLATFIVVTTEMLPVGLLTPISEQFSVSVGLSGLLMALPAIVAALSSPFIILFAKQIDRKFLLIFGASLLMVCNFLAAITPYFWLLFASRILVGVCIGIIWVIAGGIAPRLVNKQHIGFATSLIFGGVAAAAVMGIPLGIFMGGIWNWRSAFIFMGGISLILILLMAIYLPKLPTDSVAVKAAFTQQLKRPIITAGLLITLLLVAGHFMVFTYIRPLLIAHFNLDSNQISFALLIYGIAGILGNFIFGMASSRNIRLSIFWIIILIIISLILFAYLPLTVFVSYFVIALWGVAYGGVSVSLMNWMIGYSISQIEITSALYIAFFNGGIALGSALGSLIVSAYSLNINLLIALVLLTFSLIVLVFSRFIPAR